MAAAQRLGLGKWLILYLSTLGSMLAGSQLVHLIEKPDMSLPTDDELRQRLKEQSRKDEAN